LTAMAAEVVGSTTSSCAKDALQTKQIRMINNVFINLMLINACDKCRKG